MHQMFPVHATPEEFENGGFTLVSRPNYAAFENGGFTQKTHEMFSVHTTPE